MALYDFKIAVRLCYARFIAGGVNKLRLLAIIAVLMSKDLIISENLIQLILI
jgi:hypothetical protein